MCNNHKSYWAEGWAGGGINNHVHLNQRLPLSSAIRSQSRPAELAALSSESLRGNILCSSVGDKGSKTYFSPSLRGERELIKAWDTSLNIFSTVSKQAFQHPRVKEGMERLKQREKWVGGRQTQHYFSTQIWLDRLKLQIAFSTQFLTLIKRGESSSYRLPHFKHLLFMTKVGQWRVCFFLPCFLPACSLLLINPWVVLSRVKLWCLTCGVRGLNAN